MSSKMLVLLGALALSTGLAQTPTVSPERELLERAVTSQWGPASLKTSVLVRQLPADLGLTLPQGSRVVGSVVTETSDPAFPAGVTVYFDTALTPPQVQAHFDRVLTQAGWKVFPGGGEGMAEGGFLPSTPIGGRPYYRQNPDQQLSFQTRVVRGVTQVALNRQRFPNLAEALRYSQDDRFNPVRSLPKLTPPAEATVSPRGGGGGGDNVTQYAGIESTLSRTALFDHYAAQLRQAGWTMRNRADVGTLTSSLWSFTQEGKERVGLLLIGEAGRGQYRATLGIQGLE
ncbi:hypothetical protein QOL99_10350 [Deinococcus sp. MIMF12]|uniref:Uncharacterized protein n=1 Tax=Deinococcus rhizophilus TaxID=3049544 RepID=A0ABT7JHL8_9DEIO|nr:hypothetical protein [Deinococcus rhizophilus]MDL2344556.1 hypothetical protein [Deinococcus rhizophilus]